MSLYLCFKCAAQFLVNAQSEAYFQTVTAVVIFSYKTAKRREMADLLS